MKLGFMWKCGFAWVLTVASAFSSASVTYDFAFSGLSTAGNFPEAVIHFDNFNISLTYTDYVHATGLFPVSGPTQPTSLGFGIAYAGANPSSQWAFDDDGAGGLDDSGFLFNGLSLWTFFYWPTLDGFISKPGTYYGTAVANASFTWDGLDMISGLDGFVMLNVSDNRKNLLEPPSLLLLFAGVAALLVRRRVR